MEKSLFLGGVGGQGVVYGGKLISSAAVEKGMYATAYASYSPAMRNGFAYSTVILSPSPVLAQVTSLYDCMAFFDPTSCKSQSGLLRQGGTYILNASLAQEKPAQPEARTVKLRANHIAAQLGDGRMLNNVMLGAIIGATEMITLQWLKEYLLKAFGAKEQVALANIKALEAGFNTAKEQL